MQEAAPGSIDPVARQPRLMRPRAERQSDEHRIGPQHLHQAIGRLVDLHVEQARGVRDHRDQLEGAYPYWPEPVGAQRDDDEGDQRQTVDDQMSGIEPGITRRGDEMDQRVRRHHVITTDRRSYHLQLTSTGKAAMAALSWSYPQDALIALQRAAARAESAAPVASGLELDRLNFDYGISGDRPAWRPLRAFDDGRQTFIEFPASLGVGEAPPLFLVDRNGDAQLVNYRIKGRFYVVDRLFDAAELRLGTKDQDVVRISRSTPSAAGRRIAS